MKVKIIAALGVLVLVVGAVVLLWNKQFGEDAPPPKKADYKPRVYLDTSGFGPLTRRIQTWRDPTSLEDVRSAFDQFGSRELFAVEKRLAEPNLTPRERLESHFYKTQMYLYDGDAKHGYETLLQARDYLTANPQLEEEFLYTVIFLQGVASLRRGENENCIECRGEGACLFPISASAVHLKKDGSRLAIKHFTEYLEQFPDDLGVKWLLNLAYMTLGEHPQQVPEQYRLSFDRYGHDADIGKFKDIGHLLGVNRFNQAGGVVMDDFDGDGLLDLVMTTFDPLEKMLFFRNKGDGTFEERNNIADGKQYGGLNLVHGDYNNDGYLDIYIPRGAWLSRGIRPSLLKNNGDGRFTDVTQEAGLMDAFNSLCATFADYNNDGHLDLFVCNEVGNNRLYRNRGDSTFEEVACAAGVEGNSQNCKGATWFDYDNDGYPDLFLNYLNSGPQLFHNERNGKFTNVTARMGITGPEVGFSCWSFDYDNDGWIDIFSTCYQRNLDEIISGIVHPNKTTRMGTTKLFRNMQGKEFKDVSEQTGVNKVFATMGSNFADFDNDGYLDFYLATGEPPYSTLIPNRMFKNMGGKHFAEITSSARTGNLQKGHGVACGDWDRDGNIDLFAMLGGASPGDRFHNAMFQNPGQGNNWLNVKLVGQKSNRSALGARIKVVTKGSPTQTIQRHVNTGSSFGNNPLEQQFGLSKATEVATLEVHWPTSGTTQTFHNLAVNQAIEITEGVDQFRVLPRKRVPLPKE